MRAMELNGVQVDNNKAAFEWGRRCAHDLAAVQALFAAAQVIEFVKKPSLDEMVAGAWSSSPATRTRLCGAVQRLRRQGAPAEAAGQARAWPRRWRATCSS
jgi:hypothetical protein